MKTVNATSVIVVHTATAVSPGWPHRSRAFYLEIRVGWEAVAFAAAIKVALAIVNNEDEVQVN